MISTRRSRLPWARPETLAFDASPEPELGVKCLRNQDFEVAVRRIGVRARSNRNWENFGLVKALQRGCTSNIAISAVVTVNCRTA